jgi:hypothetical protein
MTVGQILDRVYRLLRANFKLFVGIAAMPPLAFFGLLAVIAAAASPFLIRLMANPSRSDALPIVGVVSVMMVLFLPIHFIIFGLYSAAASDAAVRTDRGETVSFRQAYATAWKHAGRYLLLVLIIYLVCFGPALLMELLAGIGMALATSHPTQASPAFMVLLPLVFLLFAAAMIAGLIVALRFSLSFPASVTENLPPLAAMKRSSVLTRAAKARICLVMLVVYAATYLMMMLVECGVMLVGVVGFFAWSGLHVHPPAPVIWLLAGCGILAIISLITLFSAFSWAGYATAFAVIYNDQRARVDGVAPSIPGGVTP